MPCDSVILAGILLKAGYELEPDYAHSFLYFFKRPMKVFL